VFGIYRTILACFVVIGHLGTAPFIGTYSVFGFYILSGYLMTRIMHRSYGYNFFGVSRYLANRFLRIYPLYWLSIFFSFILISLFSEQITTTVSESIYYPKEALNLIKNVLIILTVNTEPRLTPPSWALSVEFFYYVIIAAGLSRTKELTIIWFILSVSYTIYLLIGNASFSYRYYTIAAASLPFALGSLIFFIPIRNTNNININIFFTTTLLVINYFLNQLTKTNIGFYVNIFLFSIIIFNLSKIKNNFLTTYDSLFGNLSYPIYLLHYQSGILIIWFFSKTNIEFQKGDLVYCLASLSLCLLLSYLLANILENRIEYLRNKIRPKIKHQ
jgi:peptidoglycan/LPS O-acetylase OafA/YrhL